MTQSIRPASRPQGDIFLSIVIPAHNEERRLVPTLEKVSSFLRSQPWKAEVLVVENGSADRTFEVAAEYAKGYPELRVLRETARGKGLAVRRGMIEARGRFRFLCDADLSMPIENALRFLPPALENCDVAIGSREAAESNVTEPMRRRRMGRMFNRLVRLLVLPGIRDTQCGFKCFSAAAAEFIFPRQQLTGMSFDVEVLYIARRRGYKIVEVPITWQFDADSRVRLVRDSMRMAADLLTIRRNAARGQYD
jgi:dolichyl-phosphate beta-glucosyltransferase